MSGTQRNISKCSTCKKQVKHYNISTLGCKICNARHHVAYVSQSHAGFKLDDSKNCVALLLLIYASARAAFSNSKRSCCRYG